MLTNFSLFILIFINKMALIYLGVLTVFTVQVSSFNK